MDETREQMQLNIVKKKLSRDIKGFSAPTDGGYLIAINTILDPDEQAAAFLHECLHIWRRDHITEDPAELIEEQTHKQLNRVLEILTRPHKEERKWKKQK